ncbi:T9SS type A sorting domain-containing protein [Marinilabilia sp.]|uniref:T9SS type A sorting domain-containing protein n=1 Tax=Marinilabilia sp. TaxID=2021252 RepID=UPI0025B9B20A|nr:T9SS type A sorting domain-containing protein [Marinilabilia sp.]
MNATTRRNLSFLFTFLIVFSPLAFIDAQVIVKVKPSDKGGITFSDVTQHNTWGTATFELQKAIDEVHASGGGEVWVAGGTYLPTSYLAAAPDAPNPPLQDPGDPGSPIDERQLSFIMASGVSVIGGFTGSETSLEQRPSDFYGSENKVVLSGDIGTASLAEDNAYHVVIFPPETDNTAILQNVVISGGYANGPDAYFAKTGAGVHIREGGLLKECQVQNNVSAGSGGGVYLYKGGKVRNCTIFENTAFVQGGGVYSNLGGEISRSAIFKNTAGNYITDGKGGGVFLVADETQEGTITHSAVFANSSTNKGGGIATYAGGRIINNYIGNNETEGKGGGIFLQVGGLVLNSTVVSNAGGQGAAIFCNDGGTVYNTVMWGNTTPYNNNQLLTDDDDATSSTPLFDFCAIQEGTSTPEITNLISLSPENTGTGVHPYFRNPVTFAGLPADQLQAAEISASDYRINVESALLDAGINNPGGIPLPPLDLDATLRLIQSSVDIGAFEADYFDITGTVSIGNGTIDPIDAKILNSGEVLFTLTPETGFEVTTFTINGDDFTPSLIPDGNSFTYTATVSENIDAVVTFGVANSLIENKTGKFRLYPVPAESELFISGASIQKVEIFSTDGKPVKIMEKVNISSIPVSGLKRGLYFISLTDDTGKVITTRFIKK